MFNVRTDAFGGKAVSLEIGLPEVTLIWHRAGSPHATVAVPRWGTRTARLGRDRAGVVPAEHRAAAAGQRAKPRRTEIFTACSVAVGSYGRRRGRLEGLLGGCCTH